MSEIFAGKKILWVEDDLFLSDILAKKLTGHGAELFHAENGEDALKLVSQKKPDIILLDILLPGISGFEILGKIKADEATKNIPVILLSNLNQEKDIEAGKRLGAARFLVKATVMPDEIVKEMIKVMGLNENAV
jgi:CheY-like chemotaxis protein